MTVQSSRGAQRELRSRKDTLDKIRARDLASVMSTVEGRRFIFDLLDRRCLVFSQSYTGNSETFLREGMRKVGIELMKEVQDTLTDLYVRMLNEQLTMQQQNRLAEEAAKSVAATEEL